MRILTKFEIREVQKAGGGNHITLRSVMSGSQENEQFFAETPTGGVDLQVVRDEVANQFVPGKECYVIFTDEPQPQAGE